MKTNKDDASRGDRRSQLPISGPSDFVHVVHMGPGHVVELQNLIELRSPTNNATTASTTNGSQSSSHNQQMKQLANPVMRSTSNTSDAPASILYHSSSLQNSLRDSRPLSSHSRNSDESSLGGKERRGLPHTHSDSMDNYYLEPISKRNVSSPQQQQEAMMPRTSSSSSSSPSIVTASTTVGSNSFQSHPQL